MIGWKLGSTAQALRRDALVSCLLPFLFERTKDEEECAVENWLLVKKLEAERAKSNEIILE